LKNLKWVHLGKGAPIAGGLYVSKVRWRTKDTEWAPFPWRKQDGSIRYPREGVGWYWSTEIEAAITRFPEQIEILDTYQAEGLLEYPFRELIRESFNYRLELKKNGHPSNVAVKLILNSLYGKFAQTVGTARFYSAIWAGLITAQTRAQLLQVLSPDVVCMMTDSIWSTHPISPEKISLSNATHGSSLGTWEKQDETRLVLAEAGLYEATKPDGTRSLWQRGFDKRTPVDIPGLVHTWLYEDPTYSPVYKVNRFIGMGLASVTSYPWRKWVILDRKIEPVPLVGTSKRLPLLPDTTDPHTHDGFVRLNIRPRDNDTVSAPYKKLLVNTSLIQTRLEDECLEE